MYIVLIFMDGTYIKVLDIQLSMFTETIVEKSVKSFKWIFNSCSVIQKEHGQQYVKTELGFGDYNSKIGEPIL